MEKRQTWISRGTQKVRGLYSWFARAPENAISGEPSTSEEISSQVPGLRINRNTLMHLLWLQKDRMSPLINNYLISRNLKPEKKIINHLDFISSLTTLLFGCYFHHNKVRQQCLRCGYISWVFWLWKGMGKVMKKIWNWALLTPSWNVGCLLWTPLFLRYLSWLIKEIDNTIISEMSVCNYY